MPSGDRQFIKSLARGFKVLSAFRAEDRGLSNAELARRTGFPKPTVSRLTFTLLSLGYLHFDEDTGRYFLHPHILTLGYPVLRQLSIREFARPLMQELADSVRGAVVLGIRDGLSMIIVERARHRSMATWPLDIGVARDMATTALGRAYLVALGETERQELLEEIRADDVSRWAEVERRVQPRRCYSGSTMGSVVGGAFFPRSSAGFSFTLWAGTPT